MEYYSAIKNNDILKFAGKWTELEKKVILSEVTQIQEDKYVRTHEWIPDIKQRITSLQSTTPVKLALSSRNRWKQMQRSTAKHWAELPEYKEREER